MPSRAHALVVGGTGMLAGASLHLARTCGCVSLLARNPIRLYDLQRRAASERRTIHPIIVDYCNSEALSAAIPSAAVKHGAFDFILSWIHSGGSSAIAIIADHVRRSALPCDWVQVLASSEADSDEQAPSSIDAPNVRIRHVRLGFKIEDGRSRWLTDEEISSGVIEAIERQRPFTVVGTVEPRSARPV